MSVKLSRRTRLIIISSIGAALIAALAIFQPWLAFVNTEVNDTIPSAAQPQTSTGPSSNDATRVQGPVLVAKGDFISHEHTTTGTAAIYRLPDGSHQLAIENLSTTTGPDVRVWLSAGPVVEGKDGWTTAGTHPHLELSLLKGNRGNQVYPLPAGTDPLAWPSIDLWCKAFGVSFGAAALKPVM